MQTIERVPSIINNQAQAREVARQEVIARGMDVFNVVHEDLEDDTEFVMPVSVTAAPDYEAAKRYQAKQEAMDADLDAELEALELAIEVAELQETVELYEHLTNVEEFVTNQLVNSSQLADRAQENDIWN